MDMLKIINMALLKTGLPLAATLNDCDWNARFVFENSAEEALRGYAWGFAQKLAVLTSQGAAPSFGFDHAYPMPADCLRVIDCHACSDLRSPKARYVIQARSILCNANPLYLRYVAKILDPAAWPPDFADAVACRIALEIAALSAERASMAGILAQRWQLALAQAQLSDARENTERVPLDSPIYAARAGESGGREKR